MSSSSSSPSSSSSSFSFFALAVGCLACGLAVHYGLPPLVELYIDQQLALTPGSQTYPLWLEAPVPVYQRFYFYNVTNAADVEQRGAKPHLAELGPFTYRSEWTKRDLLSDGARSLVSFKHLKRWHFEPGLSLADERLQLVTLNAPLAITLSLIQSASSAVRLLVTVSLDGLSEGFFTRRSVKQLLFDGYPDLLTTFGPLLNAEMLSQGGKFGYMNAKNDSLDGEYEVNTGAQDVSKLNTIEKYNGRPQLPYWHNHHGAHCNSLEGATTGEMFPPVQAHQSSLRLFQPDFCRVWRLDRQPEVPELQLAGSAPGAGLKLARFVASRDVFRNASDLPSNSCFYSHPSRRAGSGPRPPVSSTPAPELPAPEAAARAGRHRQQPSAPSPTPRPASGAQHRHNHQAHQSHQSHQNPPNHQNQQANRQRLQRAPAAPAPPTAPAAAPAAVNRPGGRHRAAAQVRHEWPQGVFSLAPCKFNAPIYVSMPHFLDADASYLAQVEGLRPERERHEFFVELEPRTGSPVNLAVRVQLNVAINKPPGLVRFRNLPEMMFPVFWQEFTVNLTGPVLDQLQVAARGAQESVQRVAYALLLLGGALLAATAAFYLHLRFTEPAGAHCCAQKAPKGAQHELNTKGSP